jgi:hypothetical protein
MDYDDYLYTWTRPHLVNDRDQESDDEIEDEDSNDENNWRNDYPDESDDDPDSVNEADMRRCVEDLNIGNNLFVMWLNLLNYPSGGRLLTTNANPLLKNKFFYRLG